MEEFVLLIKGDDPAPISPEKLQQRLGNYRIWMEKWIQKGHYLNGEPLHPVGHHLVDKDTVLSEGGFLNHKEVIGGYIKIKAMDLTEATEIAKECPLLEEFEIFVRPVLKYGE